MRAVVDDPVEERLGLDALAHEPALHVGDGDDERVDLAVRTWPSSSSSRGCFRCAVVGPGMGLVPGHGRPRWHGPRLNAYFAVIAPSATITDPVTNDDSSEARNRATFAISRGSPGLPIGWNESIVA